MALVPDRLRPYVAGVFGVVATGLGHLYLRRWLRGAGWLVLAFVVTMTLVPEEALRTVNTGETMADRGQFFPTMAIQLAGAFDAFLLAYRENTGADEPVVRADDADSVACPNCGKEVDADLEFCHWCTTEFAAVDAESD